MGAGVALTHAAPPIPTPFASADHIEGDAIQAFDLGEPTEAPDRVAFLDGIQRYAVEGRIGLIPVVRGYVAAAALVRHDGTLRVADEESEEFQVKVAFIPVGEVLVELLEPTGPGPISDFLKKQSASLLALFDYSKESNNSDGKDYGLTQIANVCFSEYI